MDTTNAPIRNILFDIDGTLVFKNKPIQGAVDALCHVQESGYNILLITNITSRMPSAVASELRNLGFVIEDQQVQTATSACAAYLRSHPEKTCHLMVPDTINGMFAGVGLDDEAPDYVVISDIGREFTYDRLNRAFGMLNNGAELIAVQKNLFWFDGDQKRLDCGAFIAGLEMASGKKARVMGKPSPSFFDMALRRLGASESDTLVVGDDVLTDISGAGHMRSVLVGTGKYKPKHRIPPFGQQTWFLNSVARLPDLLATIALGHDQTTKER